MITIRCGEISHANALVAGHVPIHVRPVIVLISLMRARTLRARGARTGMLASLIFSLCMPAVITPEIRSIKDGVIVLCVSLRYTRESLRPKAVLAAVDALGFVR